MRLVCSSEQEISIEEPDVYDPVFLIERGLQCFEQGHFAEGTAFLALARERLFPDRLQFSAALDVLHNTIAGHLQAQQALHEASKRFAESNTETQIQLEALKKLLPSMTEESLPASSPRTRTRKLSSGEQLLRVLPPLRCADASAEGRQTTSSRYSSPLPALYITCFGRFQVRRSEPSGEPLKLCNNLKGQAILRYLVTAPRHRETVEMLLDVLWPDEDPEIAEHKLRVAASALRCSLNREVVSEAGGGYILCKEQVYSLNPAVQLYCDADEFQALYQAGQKAGESKTAALYYEQACQLYSGSFLAEDIYAGWSYLRREELTKMYVIMCDKLAEYHMQIQCYDAVVKWASAMLKVDRCEETGHRQLMRAYAAQGRRCEALRQYQACQRVLSEELGVQPLPETQKLFQMLVQGEQIE